MNCASKFRDINNFSNASKTRLPHPSSLPYDGLFNSNFFPGEITKTFINKEFNEEPLVNAHFSFAKETNPITSNEEYFFSILMDSKKDGIKEITQSLDLVIVLDNSGSMSSCLPNIDKNTKSLTCLELAKESIKKLNEKFHQVSVIQNHGDSLIKHRIGLCIFDDHALKIFDLNFPEDLQNLEKLLEPIKPKGGTNLYVGLKKGYDIMKANLRHDAEKKILYLTDMSSIHDKQFFDLLKQISEENISVDIIGIGQNLNLENSQFAANIKNVSIHSVFKQEEMQKILVDDFEFTFFPIAKDFKIEFFSNNLKIKKTYGTGYEETNKINTKKHNNNEEDQLLKDMVKDNKSILIYFDLLKKLFRQKFKKNPLFVLQTILNFLTYQKKEVTEFEKLYPSETILANKDDCKKENFGEKSIKGNMILLKLEIDDMELHRKSNQKEFAEVVFEYINCENQKNMKTYFPMLFDFKQLNVDNNSIYNNKLVKEYENRPFFKHINKNSQAINIAISLYYGAKFMRKIMKISHKSAKKIKPSKNIFIPECFREINSLETSNSVKQDQENEDNSKVTDFLKKENLEMIISKFKKILSNRLLFKNEIEIGKDMEYKIENLIKLLEK